MGQLDKSKPYGVVMGESIARFEQNGKQYDENEEEIVREEAPTKPVKTAKPAPKELAEKNVAVGTRAVTVADQQLAAQVAYQLCGAPTTRKATKPARFVGILSNTPVAKA